jgi:hypothetical protein
MCSAPWKPAVFTGPAAAARPTPGAVSRQRPGVNGAVDLRGSFRDRGGRAGAREHRAPSLLRSTDGRRGQHACHAAREAPRTAGRAQRLTRSPACPATGTWKTHFKERVTPTSDVERMVDDWATAWSSSDYKDPHRVPALVVDDCVFQDVSQAHTKVASQGYRRLPGAFLVRGATILQLEAGGEHPVGKCRRRHGSSSSWVRGRGRSFPGYVLAPARRRRRRRGRAGRSRRSAARGSRRRSARRAPP